MSQKTHTRTSTYEGPQMNFKFPGDEDLILQNISKEDVVELTGPIIEPYAESVASKRAQKNIKYYSVPQDHKSSYEEVNNHRYKQSNLSSSYVSNPSTNNQTDTTASIPTQDNVSYQITDEITNKMPSRQTSLMSSIKKSPVRREPSKGNISLYRKASLKRSKAVKYRVGWLTRLKQMGVNIKNKLRKWRMIPSKKSFNTTGRRFTIKKRSFKKTNISMPLERGRAKSISELRREIDDWYVPQKQLIPTDSVQEPPAATHRVVSSGSNPVFQKVPPPLPPHRIASSTMVLNDQVSQRSNTSLHQKTMNRSLSTPSGVNINQPQHKVQPTLLQPQSAPYHPYQDLASTEDITNPHMSYRVIYDEGELNSQFDERYYSPQEDEDSFRKLWQGYLRRAVAARIQSKLEIYKIAQIPEPAEQQEYADEIFGIISDYDTEETISDFDDADDESLTSVSGSEFSSIAGSSSENMSDSISETTSAGMSEASTNYFSICSRSAATSPPVQISNESYAYLQAHLQNVKRSSTLPNSSVAYQSMNKIAHNRFQSVLT